MVADQRSRAALKFRKLAEKNLAGKVEVQVFPNSQLFGDSRNGSLLLGRRADHCAFAHQVGKYTPKLQITTCPSCSTTSRPWTVSQANPGVRACSPPCQERHHGSGLPAQRHEAAQPATKPLRRGRQGPEVPHQASDVLAQFKAVGGNPQKWPSPVGLWALQTGWSTAPRTLVNIYTEEVLEVQTVHHGATTVCWTTWSSPTPIGGKSLPDDALQLLKAAMVESTVGNERWPSTEGPRKPPEGHRRQPAEVMPLTERSAGLAPR